MHLGREVPDQLDRSALVKLDRAIDPTKGLQEFDSILSSVQRALWALVEPTYRVIAVHPNDEQIAEGPGLPKIANVAHMKKVEDPVRKNEASTLS